MDISREHLPGSAQAFSHNAFYNASEGRVEMHLVSSSDQTVTVAGHAFEFTEGETIHTGNSCKYDVEEFMLLAEQAGFASDQVWTDDQ